MENYSFSNGFLRMFYKEWLMALSRVRLCDDKRFGSFWPGSYSGRISMGRVFALLATASLLASPVSAAAPEVATATPLDATLACFRDTLGASGRLVTINTAGGALLDFTFEAVAADGRPGQSRIAFTIEDEGTRRRISATATEPADAALAVQLLQQTAKACLADAG